MNDDDRKRVAHGVAFEEAVFEAHVGGGRTVKLPVDAAYSVANEVKSLRREKDARVYYQSIVYEVAAMLEVANTGHMGEITAGDVEHPSRGVQEALDGLLRRRGASRQDTVWLAMHQAVEDFGGEEDGVFNAAGFGAALMRIAGLRGVMDGHLVRAILSGRTDVEMLKGDAHFRLLGER